MKKETVTQLYVRYDGEEELSKLMAYLNAHGYENVGHLDARSYTFPVVCVDPNGSYFGTNTTCMAAAEVTKPSFPLPPIIPSRQYLP